jgi:hypothetical protein
LDLDDYHFLAVVDDRVSPLQFVDSLGPIPNVQAADRLYAGLNQSNIQSEISVQNDRVSTFTWKAATGTPWITLNNPGPHSSDAVDTLSYSIDHSSLSAGTYNGIITVTTTYNGQDFPHQVDISLVLLEYLYQAFLSALNK